MCIRDRTRAHFPLLSHLVLLARPTSSSWMMLLLMCRPPLDRHLLFPLQDLPLAQLRCHTRPPAPRRHPRCHARPPVLPRCHAQPPAARQCPQQAPQLSLDRLGRRLAFLPERWTPRRQPPAPDGLLHRRPLFSPGRPLRHQACSRLARRHFTGRPPPSSTSMSNDSSPLLVLLLPCPREPYPFPPW